MTQDAVTTYGKASRSHATSTRLPSRPRTWTVTSALSVPAFGYRTVIGVLPGSAGSAMCHTCTGVSSTRATSSDVPSGDHQ